MSDANKGMATGLIDMLVDANSALTQSIGDAPDYLRITQAGWDALRASPAVLKAGTQGPAIERFMGLPVVIWGSRDDLRRIARGEQAVEVTL